MTVQERRQLGKSGLEVTALGFGGAPLGGFNTTISESEATATVLEAYDGGLRLFDTSPYYGYGRSELRCGQALRNKPRESYLVSTKVGRILVPLRRTDSRKGIRRGGLPFRPVFDYTYDGAMRSYEHSVARLGIGPVDILLIHDLDEFTHGNRENANRWFDVALDGAWRALQELRRSGDVKAIGVGLNDSYWCRRFLEATDIDCILLAGRYTLLDQSAADLLLPECQARQVGVILGGPYNSGILATGAVAGARYNYAEAAEEIVVRVQRIEHVCNTHGVPLQAAALQFPLLHPAVCTVIAGAISREEVAQNIGYMGVRIPPAFWQHLHTEGLVSSCVSSDRNPDSTTG